MPAMNSNSEVKLETFREELMHFLARRFGSIPLAERIYREIEVRTTESDILNMVGDPKVYLSSFGLSLGMQYLQEELGRGRLWQQPISTAN